jgi:hypothetical protein
MGTGRMSAKPRCILEHLRKLLKLSDHHSHCHQLANYILPSLLSVRRRPPTCGNNNRYYDYAVRKSWPDSTCPIPLLVQHPNPTQEQPVRYPGLNSESYKDQVKFDSCQSRPAPFLHDAAQPVDCLASKPRQMQIQKSLTPLACTSRLTRYVQLLYKCESIQTSVQSRD